MRDEITKANIATNKTLGVIAWFGGGARHAATLLTMGLPNRFGVPELTTPATLARELFREYPVEVPTSVLFKKAEAAHVDVQEVDRELDNLREAAEVKRRQVAVDGLRIADLTGLASVRTRIKGVAYWVTLAERSQFGGSEYLLIPEPDNEADPKAVAVYGIEGRKVGHLSVARAAALTPLLAKLESDAFKVAGEGASANSSMLWVYVPKTEALRRFAR